MSEIDAVCFDLDDTLCVSEQTGAEIHRAAFERVSVDQFIAPEDVYAVDLDELPMAESNQEFYENLYRAATARVDADPDSETFGALAEATVEVVDPTAVSFRPGASEAFERAREHYPLGLITNGSAETQRAKLDALGIADAFETTVYCDPAAGIDPKPDPTPFEHALSGLGTLPDRTLYVGNRHGSDVMGAHAAGLQSAWVPHEDDSEPSDPEPVPTYHLDSMRELRDVL